MGLGQALLLTLAILAVCCLPALFALIFCADEIIDRVACGWAEWREQRRERRTIDRLDRAVEAEALTRDIDLTEFEREGRRPLEQLANDLRRLGGHRLAAADRSVVWHGAVIEAYDERLRAACHALGITEHLTELNGVDREIERVRVEGLLHAAGLTLPAARAAHHQRHR
ncbi:hypothetical protein O7602_26290 [Micromonospora sp. WMMD1128]|uniref:hypothetical protein n=1 Tax=unclassified Micromonospora TaxID=2617518 RepID=UPI00248C8B5D|nr:MULTISPECIES: hypothetical protein [unclassified Micromonospora]WBB73159.1 hypothetical protein O7602_26290 [Micromonospora sp. WMMD1128]WFE33387.1 hypothetical protein O7613_28345 [Micromonospora sp. WMMD975]